MEQHRGTYAVSDGVNLVSGCSAWGREGVRGEEGCNQYFSDDPTFTRRAAKVRLWCGTGAPTHRLGR